MLDALFRPKSVAVVGASAKELTIGNRIIKNLVDFGFKGPIYPINGKVKEIWGVKTYPSILDVPSDVDVAHLAIPATGVPESIEHCGKKGVKFVILNGGGFAEIGPAGAAIEEDCLARAKKFGIRIFGPNCQGIINTDPDARAYCNFTFTKPHAGVVSMVALSGGVAELIHQALAEMGVGTRMYASNGNACDVSIPEIIRYYGDDSGTKAIVLYMEGLKEPEAFLEVTRRIAARKPILAMKAGRSEEGAKAAASHTGGLAKEDIATDLIFEKAGILSFRNEAEMCEAAAAFSSQPIPKGKRVGIITNTGGPAVIATDVLAEGGLSVPSLSDNTKAILKGKLFAEASISNPVDVLATAGADHFRAVMDAMMEEDGIDSIYINFVTPFFVDNDSIARQIVEVNTQRKKPIVCNLMTDRRQWSDTVRILKDGGIPCYAFPGAAARALVALTRYGEIRRRKTGEVRRFADVDRDKVQSIIEGVRAENRRALFAAEVYGALSAYGVPVADWRVVSSGEEAQKAAGEIGFPVAVKVDTAAIVHKSDIRGVALDLPDGRAVRDAVEKIRETTGLPGLKFLVQKCLPAGREVIVGAKAEDGLGHLVMFGLGGIHVEVLKDTVFKLSPVTTTEAEEMANGLKASVLLDGVRGEKGVDKEGLIELIGRISQLVNDVPAIREMDLNPVIAYEDCVVAVDARMSL